MEQVNDRELGIIGERYGSFLEAYRVNDRRSLNASYALRGDGTSQRLFEADEGILFAPAQTREALLYGSDLYSGRYREMRKRVRKTMLERYEWMEDERFGADVRGEHVIMERYAIGHPEAFHRKRGTVRQKHSVEIVYDAMCPASTPVSKRIESGCIVAACADALERIGYEVALTFALATYDGNSMSEAPTLLLEVALKGYGDALNVKKLEFPLAAKPVLFHLGIWWAHRFPFSPGDFGEGEGYPVSYDARRVRALEAHARSRHGAYLSEDIIEMQLKMDPTKALERILGQIGEAEVLEEHMVAKSSMQAGQSPSQGKLFGGAKSEDPLARRAQGEGGEQEAREEDARGDAAGGRRAGSAPARNDDRRENVASSHVPSQQHGGAGTMAGDSQGSGSGDGDEGVAAGESGDDGRGVDGADTGRSAAASGESGSDTGRGDAPGASERAGDDPGDGGGSGANARKPTGEGRHDTDDVEPGSDGLVGFGGLTGAPDAAGKREGGAGGRGADGGERERQPQGTHAQGATSGPGAAPGGGESEDGGSPGSDGGQGAPPASAGGSSAQQDPGGDSASGSGSGPFSPSSSGGGSTQGGGGAGGQRGPDEGEDGAQDESNGRDASEQGEAMNDDIREKREELDPQGPGELDPREDQQPDGTGHDAIPDADSQPSPEDSPGENVGDEDLEEPVRDSFIVELRKRYVRFEHGDYRRMKEKEAREAQVAASVGASAGRSVMAPPIAAVTGSDDYEFGTPRSSPFSMTYVPKRKG